MGRVKSQGCATGAKAANKRAALSRENTVKLRAFARLQRLATRIRGSEETLAAIRTVVEDDSSLEATARIDKIRSILARPAVSIEVRPESGGKR